METNIGGDGIGDDAVARVVTDRGSEIGDLGMPAKAEIEATGCRLVEAHSMLLYSIVRAGSGSLQRK